LAAATRVAFSIRPFLPLVVLVLVLVFIFRRPRGLSEAWFTAAGAALLAALGYLNATDIRAVLGQTAPTLAFLAGMLVVAFVADRAGVFRRIAERVAHRAGGSPVKLYVLLFLLGSVMTILFSLDTTAVTLTPIVLAIAVRLGLPLLPFVWLAIYTSNAASLLLPVSNLTNLIAVGYYGVPFWEYARVMLWPAVFVIVLNLILFVLLFRDQLRRGRPLQPAASGEAVPLVQEETPTIPGGPLTTTCNSDETLTRWVEVGLLALLAGLGLAPYLDWPLWEVSTATAVLLTFLALRRRLIAPVELVRKVSWSVIPFVFGLFLVIRAVEPGFYRLLEATHLLALLRTPEQVTAAAAAVPAAATTPAAVTAPAAAAAPVGAAAGHGALGLHGITGELVTAARFAVLGAVSANLVNNLPAELLFLDLAGSGSALYGLLLGVNLGPNLTIIGSLATILVLSLARQAGASVSFRDYLRLGLIMTPALLLAALAGLLLAACAGLTAPAI